MNTNEGQFYFNWYTKKDRLYIQLYNKKIEDITYKLNRKITKAGFISLKYIYDPIEAMANVIWNYLHGEEFAPATDYNEFLKSIEIQ